MVVFDPRSALLAGESIRFYSDAACTELVAAAVQVLLSTIYPETPHPHTLDSKV